jgi:hypothetical protein
MKEAERTGEENLSDSAPLGTDGGMLTDYSGTTSEGGVLGGLTSALPTILIVGAVIIGAVVILKAGKKGK